MLVLILIFNTVTMLLLVVNNFLKKRAFSSKHNCGITILVPLSKSRNLPLCILPKRELK